MFGAFSLSDAELLAVLLGTGIRGENALELSMNILRECGGVNGIDRHSISEIEKMRGVGAAKASVIKAAFELGRRNNGFIETCAPIGCSGDLFKRFRSFFHYSERETFVSVFLDSGLRLKGHYIASVGGTSSCIVDIRLITREALLKGACSLAVLHNHPSGKIKPSSEDLALTGRLADALELVGINLVDHLIICDSGYFSFADEGLIAKPAVQAADFRRQKVSCRL